MYLANDVIQNSKKKGPEYGKEFNKILKNVFIHIGESCANDTKTLESLGRILKIWIERNVYDEKTIEEYRSLLHKKSIKNNSTSSSSSSHGKKRSADTVNTDEIKEKRHKSSNSSNSNSTSNKHGKRETIEINGAIETHVILSPKAPAGDPPEPEELIKALMDLENSASADANIREKIASLPPEVSELSVLSKIEDKEAAIKLANQVHFVIFFFSFFFYRIV